MIRFLLICFALGVAAAAGAEERASDRLQRFMSGTETLQAHFVQTVVDENEVVVQRAEGMVAMRKPGRFRWHYVRPYEQEIIADGRRLWVYDVDLEQVTVKPLEEALGTAPAILLARDEPLEEAFRVTELGRLPGGGGLLWVQLEPREQDIDFNELYLGLDKHSLRQMELRDAFGQRTRIAFEGVRLNRPVDPAEFDFHPPEGVDVLGDPR